MTDELMNCLKYRVTLFQNLGVNVIQAVIFKKAYYSTDYVT